ICIVEDQRSTADSGVETAGGIRKERTPTEPCISSASSEKTKRVAPFGRREIGVARVRCRRWSRRWRRRWSRRWRTWNCGLQSIHRDAFLAIASRAGNCFDGRAKLVTVPRERAVAGVYEAVAANYVSGN